MKNHKEKQQKVDPGENSGGPDDVDRYLVLAERDALRTHVPGTREEYDGSHEYQRRESQAQTQSLERQTTDQTSTLSSSDSNDGSDISQGMSRIATAPYDVGRITSRATRTKTHPLENHRTETHRLQQVQTVGATSTKTKAERPLPNFGGGKPYPPDLPPYEDYVVEFDGPDDPLHPMNWVFKKKLLMAAVLSYSSICSTFTSSLFSASSRAFAAYFHISLEVATLSTSMYVLGYAFGPLIWGPLSELKGRKLPIAIAMFGFTVFNFGTATAFNLQTFYLCRFFTGVMGSAPLAIVAAAFSDMFDSTQRGPAIVMFSATVFLGPMLGPFIGGFVQLNKNMGWRWNLYIPGIMGALALILVVFILEESYPPIVLVSKAEELRRRTKNWGIHAKQEEVEVDFKELATKNFSRPIRLLVTEPVVLLLTIYMSFIYGLLYLFLTAYPLVFQGVHGFNAGVGGLPFFGMVVGIVLVAAYIIWDSKNYNKKLQANGGMPVPEWRLPPVMAGGVLFATGLLWFGWSGYKKDIPWIVPTLSGLFTGAGLLAIFIQCFNYLIDTYLMFAASVIAANTLLRSVSAAGFPLFARQMFNGLGIQWAGTLLGCFAFLLVPIPVLFYLFGKNLRAKSKFAPTMKRKPPPQEHDSDSADGEQHDMVALAATRSRAHVPELRSRRSGATTASRATKQQTNASRHANGDIGPNSIEDLEQGSVPMPNTKGQKLLEENGMVDEKKQ